jgi:hypothetical protein
MSSPIEITIRWSLTHEDGRVSKRQREKLVAGLKKGDILTMDMVKDSIYELISIYEEGGYTLGLVPDPTFTVPG